jgi:hypothetical protein
MPCLSPLGMKRASGAGARLRLLDGPKKPFSQVLVVMVNQLLDLMQTECMVVRFDSVMENGIIVP